MSLRTAQFALVVVFCLRVAATLLPTSWLWGLDSLADPPAAISLAGLILFGLALVPAVGRSILRAVDRAGRRIPKPTLVVGGVGLALAALYVLRSQNFLLGDIQTYLSSLDQGVRSAGGAHREPLPQAIVTELYLRIARPLGWTSQAAFTTAEILLAAAFLSIGTAIARAVSRTMQARVALFSFVSIGGGLQLFAGYAEFYGFALVAVLLFAWLGLLYLDGRGNLFAAVAAFVLAGLCHAQVVFAAPAVVYLVCVAWTRGRRVPALLGLVAIPVWTVAGLLLLDYPFGEIAREAARAGTFLPPLGQATDRTAYPVFSAAHLAELLSVILLVAPTLPAAVALGARRSVGPRPRSIFLAALAAGPILFALCANPQLGMVRDWDIFVLPVTLGALWAGAGAATLLDTAGSRGAAIAGAIALTSLLHAGFWIGANHDADRSRERVRRVAGNPALFGPQSLGEVWRYIGGRERSAGQVDRAAESLLHGIEAYPDERMTYRLLAGIALERALRGGRSHEEGLADYHRLLASIPAREGYGRHGGCFAALAAGREDLAFEEAQAMVRAEPEHPEILATWGDILRRGGIYDAAREAYETALEHDPDQPRARLGLACLAGIRGDRSEMESLAREALRRTPWSPQAQQFARILDDPAGQTPELCRRFLYVR